VFNLIIDMVLGGLVLALGVLLIIRQRQLKRAMPFPDLESALKDLEASLMAGRTEGKIQTVACQLSVILANYLKADRILFFRKQKRFMELNYVFGLKNLKRAQYRIRITNGLAAGLTTPVVVQSPESLREHWGEELGALIDEERFNIVFPIHWLGNLFGVYFIRTSLAVNHPIIQSFLLFLNQNLSAVYQINRLESARQALEQQVESDRKRLERMEAESGRAHEGDNYPGHLIEMFTHRRVEDLVANLFDKVKAGLQAEKLVFVSLRAEAGNNGLRFAFGIKSEDLRLDGPDFDRVFGRLNKQKVYEVSGLSELPESDSLRVRLERARIKNLAVFSLGEGQPGLLLWAGKGNAERDESRILTRLEKVAQRAMSNAREFERIEAMSYTDSLTRLYNHRYFVKRLHEEILRAQRYHRDLGLLLFDIDDFKMYNDRFGHQMGDALLRKIGTTVSRTLRAIDIVSRYGGDEFCIIMPEADRATCQVSMERIRDTIAVTGFQDLADGFDGKITISAGSAVFPNDADSDERLIYSADMALLQSKAQGRNRCTLFDHSPAK
jgi:diguanylate cyclase (GGDEF)-like protein